MQRNPEDCKNVWDFFNSFDKEAKLDFASSKTFWENFLAGRISEEEISKLHEQYKVA